MSNNNLKSNRVYYETKRLMYILMINIYFLISISPFIIYFLVSGTSLSIYILSFLGIIIGPALATLFSVLGRLMRSDETQARKDFLYFYKLNFLQGIFAGAIISIILLMSYLDIQHFFGSGLNIISYIFIGISVFTLVISLYVFPIIARINAKTLDVFKIAIEKTFKKFYLTITIISIIIIFLFIVKLLKIALIAVLFGPIALAYLILILEKNTLIDAENYLKEKYSSATNNE